jgi:hypothetical protein
MVQQETIGLALAISSSAFIGSSFIIKKRGLRAAGAAGIRAGQAIQQLSAALCMCMSCCPGHLQPQPRLLHITASTLHKVVFSVMNRCRRLWLPQGANMVGRPAVHGGWRARKLCCIRVRTSNPGHTSGSTQHNHQVRGCCSEGSLQR